MYITDVFSAHAFVSFRHTAKTKYDLLFPFPSGRKFAPNKYARHGTEHSMRSLTSC